MHVEAEENVEAASGNLSPDNTPLRLPVVLYVGFFHAEMMKVDGTVALWGQENHSRIMHCPPFPHQLEEPPKSSMSLRTKNTSEVGGEISPEHSGPRGDASSQGPST